MKGHRKIAVSLPFGVVDDLDTVCSRLRVTRSALLTSLLQEPVRDLVQMSAVLSAPVDSVEKIRRFRGESVGLVNARLSEFQGSIADLDTVFGAAESRVKGNPQ